MPEIAIFCYNRPTHIERTLNSLYEIKDIYEYHITVYSDGFNNSQDENDVLFVRKILQKFKKNKNIDIKERGSNFGLSGNIISGVTETLQRNESIIVLEDDVLVNFYFLEYMKSLINKYNQNKDVWHISAWSKGLEGHCNDIVFSNRMICSGGWATWSDRWDNFHRDVNVIDKLSKEELNNFDYNDQFGYLTQLVNNKKLKINTWAVYWALCIFRNKAFTIIPSRSFTQNIGFDGSGIHSGVQPWMKSLDYNGKMPINFSDEVQIDEKVNRIIEKKILKSYGANIVDKLYFKLKNLV